MYENENRSVADDVDGDLVSGAGAGRAPDETVERWQEEGARVADELRQLIDAPQISVLPTESGRGWRKSFRVVSYGITEEGVKWIDAQGVLTTSTPYDSKMCAVIDVVRYCY